MLCAEPALLLFYLPFATLNGMAGRGEGTKRVLPFYRSAIKKTFTTAGLIMQCIPIDISKSHDGRNIKNCQLNFSCPQQLLTMTTGQVNGD